MGGVTRPCQLEDRHVRGRPRPARVWPSESPLACGCSAGIGLVWNRACVRTTRVNSERRFRLGLLGSGKGSNFAAIAEACAAGRLPAEVVLVLSDVPDAGILERARERGIRALHLPPGHFRTRLDEAAEAAWIATLQAAQVDLVVLAGFMRILKPPLLRAFPLKIVNIHPSLLPSFPGLEAWKQASSTASR